MNICSEHGDDIAYTGRECPACEHVEELKDDYEQTIGNLEQELIEAEDREQDLVNQLEEKT